MEWWKTELLNGSGDRLDYASAPFLCLSNCPEHQARLISVVGPKVSSQLSVPL